MSVMRKEQTKEIQCGEHIIILNRGQGRSCQENG